MKFHSLCLPALILLAAACSSAPAPENAEDSQQSANDAAATANDAAATGDSSTADSKAWIPPPLAPPDEGTSTAPGAWLVASVANPQKDQVAAALQDGTFEVPNAGESAYGVKWSEKKPNENGQLPAFGVQTGLAYATRTFHVDAPRGLIVRADRAYDVYVDGRVQPGDVYGSGALRVPFQVAAGDHALVVRGRGGQTLSIGLETSSHAVRFNPSDQTAPDLRVGDAGGRWLGLPILVFGGPVVQITARVVENAYFAPSATAYPALAGGAATQIGFLLLPKAAPTTPGVHWPAQLRVDSPSWPYSYGLSVDVTMVAADANFRQTFQSPDDASVQYYGVRPPLNFEKNKSYSLVLSLHGASVEAIGQVGAYSARDWTYIVAPTNRRPYGFDWEEWGKINAIAALDEATARFAPDRSRIYLVGHSMGGHGTWNVGVHFAGRFALVGPSAGWNSFYSYGGSPEPKFPISRARAQSKTTDFIGNLAHRAAYVIHGTADDNVPWTEGQFMLDAVSKVTQDVDHHWEPGAGHWWDGAQAPGADCVDWLPLFAMIKSHTLDVTELDFHFTSPGPWYSPSYSYATILSNVSPLDHCQLDSKLQDGKLVLKTTNVRSLRLDGKALKIKNIANITVDEKAYDVPDGPLDIGPQTGKRPFVHGPFNQVFHQPFLFAYADKNAFYANYASYLVSVWCLIGNGHAGALPLSALTDDLRKQFNIIYLGATAEQARVPTDFALHWDDSGVTVNDKVFADSMLVSVFDSGTRLHAVISAPAGQEAMLMRIQPFSSRAGLPDWLVLANDGLKASGYFDGDWQLEAKFAVGL